ncbi:murein transglycosylase A [Methylopila turkensis]|uniref:peptidoglycan lytic exotransglycosylase n=1 Tax=Methylopila turkensis TaxID=1437816 RepID=A0A9W6JT31_9HYPH|nr:murein transglycosylase A [Methylopila turkensis]GLK81575.1 transglycosylase [Methylopila turkensis]
MAPRTKAAVAVVAAALAGLWFAGSPRAEIGDGLEPVAYSELDGWAADDHLAAFGAFQKSCRALIDRVPPLRAALPPPPALEPICRDALGQDAPATAEDARRFFETRFRPVRAGRGILTGYYEPEAAGALTRTETFDTPLLARPDDLVDLADGAARPDGVPDNLTAARQVGGRFEPYPTRAEIEDGALGPRARPLVWLSRVDAFFVHIQGSTRVRLPDGRIVRIAYAGRNGQPFTPIGRLLVQRGEMAKDVASMQALRAWLAARPAEGRAIMRENRSYIFFRVDDALRPEDGPRGAQAAPLTAGRSIAVDRQLWAYGLPFWIEGRFPSTVGGGLIRRLTIAQDTGSAILGQARGDYFAGSGDDAGAIAGGMREQTGFFALIPRESGRDQ